MCSPALSVASKLTASQSPPTYAALASLEYKKDKQIQDWYKKNHPHEMISVGQATPRAKMSTARVQKITDKWGNTHIRVIEGKK